MMDPTIDQIIEFSDVDISINDSHCRHFYKRHGVSPKIFYVFANGKRHLSTGTPVYAVV